MAAMMPGGTRKGGWTPSLTYRERRSGGEKLGSVDDRFDITCQFSGPVDAGVDLSAMMGRGALSVTVRYPEVEGDCRGTDAGREVNEKGMARLPAESADLAAPWPTNGVLKGVATSPECDGRCKVTVTLDLAARRDGQ